MVMLFHWRPFVDDHVHVAVPFVSKFVVDDILNRIEMFNTAVVLLSAILGYLLLLFHFFIVVLICVVDCCSVTVIRFVLNQISPSDNHAIIREVIGIFVIVSSSLAGLLFAAVWFIKSTSYLARQVYIFVC